MSAPYFTDRDAAPTDQTIARALGRAAGAWGALFERLRADGLRESWKYYADGKSWLLKVSRGTNTVCWVVVERGAFRVGFYVPERALGTLLASDLSDELKAELRAAATRRQAAQGVDPLWGPARYQRRDYLGPVESLGVTSSGTGVPWLLLANTPALIRYSCEPWFS